MNHNLEAQALDTKDGVYLQVRCQNCDMGSFGFGAGMNLGWFYEEDWGPEFYYEDVINPVLDDDVLEFSAGDGTVTVNVGHCENTGRTKEEWAGMAADPIEVSLA